MSYWRVFYHLVWATKNREPLIASESEAILRRSFQLTSDDLGLIVHAVGAMPEHIHIALSIPPKVAVAEAVKRLKGASSFAVGRDLPDISFGWQDGYGCTRSANEDCPLSANTSSTRLSITPTKRPSALWSAWTTNDSSEQDIHQSVSTDFRS